MAEENADKSKKFTEWHGIPREEIDWHSTIDPEKCIACGMCITGCSRGVYEFDYEQNKVVVAHPERCMVGCTTCQTTCLQDAISFPPKERVRQLIREKHVLTQTKKELLNKKEKYAFHDKA